jgi:hypothetical protein
LLKSATTSQTLQTNTQPLPSSIKMTDKRMPTPGSKDAPKFKSSHPEELRRFISRMEDLWDECKVTDDEKKKTMIGKYADIDSEEEWSAFNSYGTKNGSWDDFKKELISNYPEAAAAERGTPARLKQICAETSMVRLGDLPTLYRFRRAFLTEARKLQKEPVVVANRELVELFFSCLSEALASAVLQYLGNKGPSAPPVPSSSSSSQPKPQAKDRRPEDRYDLEAVCAAAVEVSENSQGIFDLLKKESSTRSSERDVFMFNQPSSENKVLSEKVEEMEGVQALERDRMVNMNKMIETRIGELENLMKTLVAQGQNHAKGDCKNGNCKMHEASSNPAQKGGRSLENEKCFWCALFGHFQADCEDLKNQIRLGNVKVNHEGKLRLRDGSFIPKYPAEASLKERVEKHYAKKPSQFYYGEYDDNDPTPSVAPNALSQLLGSSNDADKRTIAQLKAELDLRRREEALELKQRMLEESEKKMGQTSSSSRATNVRELLEQLTDEELVAIKTARSGFH